MSKFKLFSASALTSIVAAATGQRPSAETEGGSDEGADTTTQEADQPADDATTDQPSNSQPSGDAPAGDEGGSADASAEVVSVADATAVAAEQYQAGFAAANARMSTVMASAEGQANPSQAAWMLSNAPSASAESIISQLKTFPAGANASAPSQAIPDTDVDLGRGDANAALGLTDANAKDPWAESRERVGASAGSVVARSDAGGFISAPVTSGGNSLSQPAAIRPTGN